MEDHKFIIFPIEVETGKLDISNISILSSHGEALRVKAFLQRSGLFVIILPAFSFDTKDTFVSYWKDNLREQMVNEITISSAKHKK